MSPAANKSNGKMRPDFTIIAGMVRPGSWVLDLGCGDGALLKFLKGARGVKGYGVEIDDANVHAALAAGINVLQSNLERGLRSFGDATFDVVILSQTLQAMHNIEGLMHEITRAGKEAIVSFPNLRYAPTEELQHCYTLPNTFQRIQYCLYYLKL